MSPTEPPMTTMTLDPKALRERYEFHSSGEARDVLALLDRLAAVEGERDEWKQAFHDTDRAYNTYIADQGERYEGAGVSRDLSPSTTAVKSGQPHTGEP